MSAAKKPPVSVGPGVGAAGSSVNAPSAAALEEVTAMTRRLRMPYLRAAATLYVRHRSRQRSWHPHVLWRYAWV